jgi:hypothetical protein
MPGVRDGVASAFIATAFAQEDAEAAKTQWRKVADQLRLKLPKLAACMDEAEADVLAYMDFPAAHRTKLHSTNPLERVNGEVKRRTDVVGVFPNEDAIAPPTMLPHKRRDAGSISAGADADTVIWRRRHSRHAEHDFDVVMVDLDPAHESMDHFAPPLPVEWRRFRLLGGVRIGH